MWELAGAICRSNAKDLSLEGVQVPGLMKQQTKSDRDEVRVGGYVLLMGAFGPAEKQDYVAVDLPDEDQEEALNEQWRVATEQFLHELNPRDPPIVGHPQQLSEAARQAFTDQLRLTVMLARAMDAPGADVTPLVQVAFILDPNTGTLDLAALFEDGSQTVLPHALDAVVFPIIEDVASRMGGEDPPLFVTKGETLPWTMTEGVSIGEDATPVRPVGAPGSRRRH